MENDSQQQYLSDWIEGEVAAGFVFAETAREYQRGSDSSKFQICLSDALDCYTVAAGYLGNPALSGEQRHILAINLNELRRRLDLLRETKVPPSAAA